MIPSKDGQVSSPLQLSDSLQFPTILIQDSKSNIIAYKSSLLKQLIFIITIFVILIVEKAFYEYLVSYEIDLILSFQSFLNISPESKEKNVFYLMIGYIGDSHFFFLIITHITISIYVGIDAFIALKVVFLYSLSQFFISLVCYFYGDPRPFWVNEKIRNYYCDGSFSNPETFTFSSLFLFCYLYQCFRRKQEEIVILSAHVMEIEEESEISMSELNEKKSFERRLIGFLLFVFILFLAVIFVFRYALGYGFFMNIIIGMTYFLIVFGLCNTSEEFLSKIIKESTVLKNNAKKNIFVWFLFILLLEGFVVILYINSGDDDMNSKHTINFVFFIFF